MTAEVLPAPASCKQSMSEKIVINIQRAWPVALSVFAAIVAYAKMNETINRHEIMAVEQAKELRSIRDVVNEYNVERKVMSAAIARLEEMVKEMRAELKK